MSEGSQPPPTKSEVSAALLPDFRQVFDAAPRPMLLIAADERFTMVAVNIAHARAFGATPQALQGWGVLEVFPRRPSPEVAAFVEAIRGSLQAVIDSRKPHQMATRPYTFTAPDGASSERYLTATNTPVFGRDGAVTHILSAIQDVTGEVLERRSEAARKLLMREVDHRARNALAVVQSFVRLTHADDLDDFRAVLDGRVEALARAQTSLAARRWEGAFLHEIIEAELSAMSATGRYAASGPQTLLAAQHVQSTSMVLHELATNASKYGALSTAEGALTVSWTRDAAGLLTLTWTEDGGPAVTEPSKQGFGSRLIIQLARSLQGDVVFRWRDCGLEVELRFDPAALRNGFDIGPAAALEP